MSRSVRLGLIAAVLLVVVVLLFAFVFPWFDRTFLNDPVLQSATLLRGPVG